MIYVNLFVQSNGVVAYSKLLGIWNDIYEIFFSLWMNTMEKTRDSNQKRGKKTLFKMESDSSRAVVG